MDNAFPPAPGQSGGSFPQGQPQSFPPFPPFQGAAVTPPVPPPPPAPPSSPAPPAPASVSPVASASGNTPFDMRTMASDIASVKASGGSAPAPYIPSAPPAPAAGASAPVGAFIPPPPPKPQVSAVPPFASQMGVQPGAAPAAPFTPPSPVVVSRSSEARGALSAGGKGGAKGLFAALLTVIVVVGLGAAAYFFIVPALSRPAPAVPPPAVPAPETPTIPEAAPAVIPPPATSTDTGLIPAATGTVIAPPPQPDVITHASFLKTPADTTADVTLSQIDGTAFRTALGFTTAQVASLKEAVLKDQSGAIVSSERLMAALLPTLFTPALTGAFMPDFTLVTYTDQRGTWPVYILKLAKPETAVETKAAVAAIEKVSQNELAHLFLTDPGTGDAWNNGVVNGAATRFMAFSKPSATLNVMWNGDYLVFGTSYYGIVNAAKRLNGTQ